jgi:hypothetical protein
VLARLECSFTSARRSAKVLGIRTSSGRALGIRSIRTASPDGGEAVPLALQVLRHLLRRRLADIDDGPALQQRRWKERVIRCHRRSPALPCRRFRSADAPAISESGCAAPCHAPQPCVVHDEIELARCRRERDLSRQGELRSSCERYQRSQPRFESPQQLMQGRERGRRNPRSPTNLKAGAIDRVELPGRHDRDSARRQLDMDERYASGDGPGQRRCRSGCDGR